MTDRAPHNEVRMVLQVKDILSELEKVDSATHKAITSAPVEQWCPALMPTDVNSHGNWTNNMVEILGGMLLTARQHSSFAGSLLHTLTLLRRRCAL